MSSIPVITLDGPSGTGKGTLSQRLAQHLHWHFLDSGALYRVLALAATQHTIHLTDEPALAHLAQHLPVKFVVNQRGAHPLIFLDNQDVTHAIRTEKCGNDASTLSALPAVRQALIDRQRAFRQAPGLVTDGRDMGTVIFPDATLKLFLDASPEERARRRHKQLQDKGVLTDLTTIQTELQQRDDRDRQRAIAPLKPAADALIIDTTHLNIDEVFKQILQTLPKFLTQNR
ncbi:MAG: (d)CMP kinase [Gammaproteobacteria bacterium]|nr:(d)CMP kinase [Gammaproteobacteria bacterium]